MIEQNTVVDNLVIGNELTLEFDFITSDYAVTQLCGLTINGDVTRIDAFLKPSSRAIPHAGEYLLKLFTVGFDGNIAYDDFLGFTLGIAHCASTSASSSKASTAMP